MVVTLRVVVLCVDWMVRVAGWLGGLWGFVFGWVWCGCRMGWVKGIGGIHIYMVSKVLGR